MSIDRLRAHYGFERMPFEGPGTGDAALPSRSPAGSSTDLVVRG